MVRFASGISSATKIGTDKYRVVFDSVVGFCPRTVALGKTLIGAFPENTAGVSGEVSTYNGASRHIIMTTFDSSGNATDRGFSIMVICD